MEFRPCIDIHNGKVKQIVGGTLTSSGDGLAENFVAVQDAAYYAGLYQSCGIKGGHVILLNPPDSEYYPATKAQALKALNAYPQGLQVGGGIIPENAGLFLEAGASHVIVTSYVFRNGQVHFDNLQKLHRSVGKEHLVIDLSCRKKNNCYYIVTDRWQKYTEEILSLETLEKFSDYCDEFLIHAVDAEGKSAGIDETLAALLGSWLRNPITYAGGVHSYDDLKKLKYLGQNRVNVTIGSALDLFGGSLSMETVLSYTKSPNINNR